MVQVDVDLAQSHLAKLDQGVEVLYAILLLRVEERMHRGATVAIAVLGAELGIVLAPPCNASNLGLIAGL